MRVVGKFKFWGGLACHIWGGGKELMKQLVAAGLPDRPMVIRYRARATLPEGKCRLVVHDRDPDPPQFRDRGVDARQRGALPARPRRPGPFGDVRRTGWYTTPRRDWRVQYPFGGTGMFKEGDIQEADQHRLQA
jgi:hypothetical protein